MRVDDVTSNIWQALPGDGGGGARRASARRSRWSARWRTTTWSTASGLQGCRRRAQTTKKELDAHKVLANPGLG